MNIYICNILFARYYSTSPQQYNLKTLISVNTAK